MTLYMCSDQTHLHVYEKTSKLYSMYMYIFVERNLNLFNLNGSSESASTFQGGTRPASDMYQQTGPARGLWGPWANIKMGTLGEGGSGAHPQEILRFYML